MIYRGDENWEIKHWKWFIMVMKTEKLSLELIYHGAGKKKNILVYMQLKYGALWG